MRFLLTVFVEMTEIQKVKSFYTQIISSIMHNALKSILLITAGFKETGAEGVKLEKELSDKLKKYKVKSLIKY